jgi:uncharacterized protein (UPF0548 family)
VSASSPAFGTTPSELDWVAAYEALRRAALQETTGLVRRAAGVAVLLRAGVVSWMQTCRSVASSVPPAVRPGDTMGSLPGTVRTEVAVLLAQMALSAATEMTT